MVDTHTPTRERKRAIWDIVLGPVTVTAGIVVLGHVVLATGPESIDPGATATTRP